MVDLVVLGSNSFSGAHFVQYALEQGIRVAGISRSPEPVDAFLPYRWGKLDDNFQFYQYDLNLHLEEIVNLIKTVKPKYIVNFAAQGMVAQSWDNPQHWLKTNTLSPILLHDELRKLNFLERFLQVSTPEVYGNCTGEVVENRSYMPSTPYAVSKAAVDMSLHSFYQAYNFPVLYTRASNVYGPGQQLYRILPRAILSLRKGEKLPLHGGGVSERNFIHIRDVAIATWSILLNGSLGDIYHISSDHVITIRGLVELVCELMGYDFESSVDIAPERLGKDALYYLSNQKLREELCWSPSVDLKTGISELIAWVDEYFDVLKDLPLDYLHKP